MDPVATQDQIERHLVRNAAAKKARLTAALDKLTKKIGENSKDPRAAAWKARCAEYKASLDAIAAGSYHGANGKPFGATPGITG